MGNTETLDLLVEGGKAKPGPATAPVLGALKVNIGQLFQDINERTKEYANMNVPVKIIINKKDHSYKIEIGTPPVSSLLRKELGLKKIASEKKGEEVANGLEESKAEKEKPKEEETEEGKEEAKEETEEDEEKKTKKELKREKAEAARKAKEKKKIREIVADVKMEQCVKVARMKRGSLLSKTFKNAVKEVVGSCASMPVTVEGKTPQESLRDIEAGKYDSIIKQE
jgi:large subunit ribosomal protein L11